MSGKKKKKPDKWLQGYACALSQYIQMNGINDTQSDELWKEIGSIEKAVVAGIDPADIEIFKKYYN